MIMGILFTASILYLAYALTHDMNGSVLYYLHDRFIDGSGKDGR